METERKDEQRAYPRFQVREKSSFVLNPDWPAMGEVVDISRGGFAFKYASDLEWPTGDSGNSVVFGNNESCLINLPVNVVDDFPVKEHSSDINKICRRRCLKFGELTEDQNFLLECFIWVNGTRKC